MENLEYTTEGLIDRLYNTLQKNNVTNTANKLQLDKPIVGYSNRKTTFSNFTIICKNLKREILDVKKYFEEEMCVKTTIDSNGAMIITGRFRLENIKKVLLSYLTAYVFCKECSSSDTELFKMDRSLFMKCNKCKSEKGL